MKPFAYHWNDVGAPPLSTEAGSILEIIKACLITGYGNRQPAGWKLQYDGWTAKGEQKLGFSVGDEKEQELIYWLTDRAEDKGNAYLSLWGNLNATGDGVENQITTHFQPMRRESNSFKEWHLYATNKFCLFLYQYKNFLTYQGDEGECFFFGAITDLFGEFLPQIILERQYGGARGVLHYQDCISCGGAFYLPLAPFARNTDWWGGYQESYDLREPPAIEYYTPTLCEFQKADKEPRILRLYIPSLTITPNRFHPNGDNPEWCKVLEKNGSKILRFCGRNTMTVGFDIGSDWDNPAWLNDLIMN